MLVQEMIKILSKYPPKAQLFVLKGNDVSKAFYVPDGIIYEYDGEQEIENVHIRIDGSY
jgi:hypothetical protein